MEIYGINENALIAVRKEPSERSEMVTQILFGEIFKIIEENSTWFNVELVNDKYIGWIDSKTVTFLTESYSKEVLNKPAEITKTLFSSILKIDTNELINIPFGSSLPLFDKKTAEFYINSNKYRLLSPELNKTLAFSEYLLMFNNTPYLWGGKNPFGVDCSGLVQLAYMAAGVFLPRDASQQVNIGTTIEFLNETNPGDLVFFDNNDGEIIHVGILLSKNRIIHASGKVRIDNIDHQGIYNVAFKKYTHKLRIIKRILI